MRNENRFSFHKTIGNGDPIPMALTHLSRQAPNNIKLTHIRHTPKRRQVNKYAKPTRGSKCAICRMDGKTQQKRERKKEWWQQKIYDVYMVVLWPQVKEKYNYKFQWSILEKAYNATIKLKKFSAQLRHFYGDNNNNNSQTSSSTFLAHR